MVEMKINSLLVALLVIKLSRRIVEISRSHKSLFDRKCKVIVNYYGDGFSLRTLMWKTRLPNEQNQLCVSVESTIRKLYSMPLKINGIIITMLCNQI